MSVGEAGTGGSKRLFRFRTARFGREQLPQLPKPSRALGFTGGVVVGTVAAVSVFSGGAGSRNVLAMVDTSASMRDMGGRLAKHLELLQQREGVSPTVVRTVGFGIRSDRRLGSLLESLETAVQLNPSVRRIYVFSDFSCESPSYDIDDAPGLAQLREITGSRQLFIGSMRDPPLVELVKIARDSGGEWLDQDGKPGKGSGLPAENRTKTGTVAGTVMNAETGLGLGGATVSVDSASNMSDNRGNFRISGVPTGSHKLSVQSGDLVPASADVEIGPCYVSTVNLSLTNKLLQGEIEITLNWMQVNGKPDDLDIHLLGPGKFHLYYGRREAGANLKLDNIKVPGHPPAETIYLSPQLASSTYTVDICDFIGESQDGIARSRATVRVVGAEGLRGTYEAPPGTGRHWRVLTIDPTSGKFEPIGRYVDETLDGCFQKQPGH